MARSTNFFRARSGLAVVALIAGLGGNLSSVASAADNVQLQPMEPKVDNTPQADKESSAPSTFHKLGVSKRALKEEVGAGDSDLQVEMPVQQAQRPQGIIINSTIIHLNGATNTTGSFAMMNALMGVRSRDMAKLFAERDTGYGVCGFLMNVPIERRGYAKVLRCFPSMPAALAGISPGDFIVAVDGKSTLELPAKEVWDYFTGMPGTEVGVDLLRGRQPYSVTLRRMDIGRIPDLQTRAEFLSIYQQNGMSKFIQR